MNFRDHRRSYVAFVNAQANYNEIIDDYMMAFQKTQPHSPCYGVKIDSRLNKTEEFIIESERKKLKERAEDAKVIMDARRFLLDLTEEELRKSYDIYDVIYVAKWIDHKQTRELVRDLDYSTSQIYQIINRIDGYIHDEK